ncbi:MAG: RNA 3'-terminal phosphate cyclase [Planctomycetota bacterium]|nr:RNA 3'-terminal phosphate cyclase [Planctomycetota bacterium]
MAVLIDGSQGEGGGQILRSSLSLSLLTGQPFRMVNIRAKRRKPGLLRQHLTAVLAAAKISGAEVLGASIGSGMLDFKPGKVVPGEYAFAVGTAGSATLVLQTILPPLLTAGAPSQLKLEGGTHNPFAPPFDFLVKAFLPLINRMGPRVCATLVRPGFYPAGGGEFHVSITPADRLAPLHLGSRGAIAAKRAVARVAALPRTIAQRELAVIAHKLRLDPDALAVEELTNSAGPGNVVIVEVECEHVTEVFTGFGEKHVPAEDVARQAAAEAREYLAADVAVGPRLADQLLLPLALAGSGSFTTLPLSLHALTNIGVLRQFMNVETKVEQIEKKVFRVSVERKA